MTRPSVSFITVNYNQLEVTLEMIRSIYRTTRLPFEIIVVDNHSKEDPGPVLAQMFPEVKYIQSGTNAGFAKANNLGIRQAKGEYLFFVNNDTELTDGLTETLVDFLKNNPKVGAVSPMICYFPQGEHSSGDVIQYAGTTPVSRLTGRNHTIGEKTLDTGQFDTPRETAYTHGAAMMVPANIVREVGPWPEVFFLYYEELDWCEQIKCAGYEIFVQPQAKIYHKESFTIGPESPLKVFYLNRNRILFMRRNFSKTGLIPYFVFLWLVTYPKNVLTYWVKGRKDLAKAFHRGVWWNFFPTSVGDPYLPK